SFNHGTSELSSVDDDPRRMGRIKGEGIFCKMQGKSVNVGGLHADGSLIHDLGMLPMLHQGIDRDPITGRIPQCIGGEVYVGGNGFPSLRKSRGQPILELLFGAWFILV